MDEPIITVIIPTHNSEATIQRCIQSITNQAFPKEKYEIIVVDDGSKDNTVKLAKAVNADMVIETEPCTLGHARNVGFKKSRTKFIAYIDSDCEAKEGWLETIAKELETHQAITGPIENGFKKNLTSWTEYLFEFSDFNEYRNRSTTPFLPGCNQAITKECFNIAGEYPDSHLAEDVFFGSLLKQAGITAYFIPELQIRHLGVTKLNKLLSKMELYGRFTVRNSKTYDSIYKKMFKSHWRILAVFFVKIGARAIRAKRSKKFSIFLICLPLMILTTTKFCIGIWKELKNHHTNLN